MEAKKLSLEPNIIPISDDVRDNWELNTSNASWAARSSGVVSALQLSGKGLDGGAAAQIVYVMLLCHLPDVRPSIPLLVSETGFSDKSVKRAIALLERCGLIQAKRKRGMRTRYEITDLRDKENAIRCLDGIRRLSGAGAAKLKRTRKPSEVRTDLTGSGASEVRTDLTSDEGVGSVRTSVVGSVRTQEVRSVRTPKEESKIKAGSKEGNAAAAIDVNLQEEIREAKAMLRKHGLGSALWLIEPDDPRSLSELTENLAVAPELINQAMRSTQWSSNAGPGARVEHIRSCIADVREQTIQKGAVGRRKAAEAREVAQDIIASIPDCSTADMPDIPPEERTRLLRRALGFLDPPKDAQAIILKDGEACRNLIAYQFITDQHETEMMERIKAMDDDEFCEVQERYLAKHPEAETLVRKMGRKLGRIYIPFVDGRGGRQEMPASNHASKMLAK